MKSSGGDHFAAVLDDEGRIVYLGFLSTDAPDIDARSTARVLFYLAIGGPWLMGDMRTDVFDDPDFAAGVEALTTTISDGYTAGGMNLDDIAVEVAATVAELIAEGEHHIYFDPPLQGTDIVIASLEDQGVITARVVEATGKVFVRTESGTGLPFNRKFSFVVFRP